MTRSAGRAGRIVRGSWAKFPAGSTAGVPEIILAARSFRSACHEGATGRIHDEEELGAPRTPDIRDGRYADLIHGGDHHGDVTPGHQAATLPAGYLTAAICAGDADAVP